MRLGLRSVFSPPGAACRLSPANPPIISKIGINREPESMRKLLQCRDDLPQNDHFGNASERSALVAGARARWKDYMVERRIAHRIQKLRFLPPRRRNCCCTFDL